MDKMQNCIKTVFVILKEQLMQLSGVSKRYAKILKNLRKQEHSWVLFFCNLFFTICRDWTEVNDKFKIQETKCMAILSIAIKRRMKDKRTLVSLFHSHVLSLAVLEILSKESDDVKSLLKRSILNLDDFLFEIGRDLAVSISRVNVIRQFLEFYFL